MNMMKENDINILSRAAKIKLEAQGTRYVARYVGKKFNQEAPDLILEFESDEEHFIDDLEKALNEFIRDLTRRKINVVGIGITEMNLLIAELRDYEIMRKIDERNLEYMLKNHPEKVEGTPEHEKYMKELEAWEWRRLPFWQRLFWKGKKSKKENTETILDHYI